MVGGNFEDEDLKEYVVLKKKYEAVCIERNALVGKVEDQRKDIENRNAVIENIKRENDMLKCDNVEKQKLIEKYKEDISGKQKKIREKELLICQNVELIKEKENTIKHKDLDIQKKEEIIQNKDLEIQTLYCEISELNEELKKAEDRILRGQSSLGEFYSYNYLITNNR